MADEPIFLIGSILDERYELEYLLGKGGGGQVYRARQRSTGQAVAVKLLALAADLDEHAQERRRARFRREMRICGRLEHPDIVGLIDFGELGGTLYAVFELVPGWTLAQLLHAEGSLALARCRSLMRQLLEVLVYSHEHGVIHRDLKPSNIMVLGAPGHERLKVLDFGVSAVPKGTSGMLTRLTLSNEMVGTPAYAAPEQLRGDAPTAKNDLYAWGLVLLECVTGVQVMRGASLGEIFSRQLSSHPVPIPERLRAHPLGTLLRWVLEKDPARRAGSAADVLARLDAIALDDLADDGGYYADAPGSPSHRHGASPARAQPLTETASPLLLVEGERRQVTALCCRLPLRCASAAADAVLLDAYRSDLFSLCRSTVEELGGTLIGGAGDLALFYFGLPRANDTDARMAIRAALELSARIRARSATLTAQSQVAVTLKAGIHNGLLTAGNRSPNAAFAHGTVATLATALALRDGVDGEASITVSEAFRDVAHRHGEFGTSSRVDVAWQPDAIITHQLVGESLSDVFDQEAAPLIGRDDQLARLVAAWRDSTEHGRVALIRGEAGMGKSRLAHELCRIARDEGKGFLTLRFLPQMEHVALGPLLELLRAELGFDRGQAPTCAALAAVQRGFEVELDTAVPLLCTWMSVPIEAPFAPLPYSPPMQRGMLYELLVDLVRQLLARTSGYLLVEDLHWADPSTLDWLGHFIARFATTSGFVLMTARPQVAWRWDSRPPLLIDLAPLSDTQVSALVAHLPSAPRLSTMSIEHIVERADGVPLFVEELARAMADAVGPTLTITSPGEAAATQRIEGPHASRRERESARPDEVPATLRDLFASRLDSLGSAKEIAQVAAAIGREFELELLRASLPRDEATLLSDLDQLMASGLVVARRHIDRPGYLFRHALLRDAAYESLTDAARQSVHGAIAGALLGEFPARVEARPDLAALHLELAGRPYQAQEYWRVAGSKNMKDLAYDDAITHFRRGLDVLTRCPAGTPRDEAELDLLNALSGAHINRHGYGSEQLVGIFGRMRQLLDQAVEPRERELPALWTQCMLDMIRPKLTRARPCAETMLARASALGNAIFVSLAHSALSRIELWMGNHAEARRHHVECERLHDIDRDKLAVGITGEPPYISSLCFFTVSRLIQGYADAAVTEQEEGLKLTRSYEIPMIYMAHKSNLAWLHMFRGMTTPASQDLQLARRYAHESGEAAVRFGFPQWQIYAGMIASATRIFQGDKEEVATLQTLMGAWEGAGADIHFCWLLGCVAHGLLLQSDFDQAARVLARARAHVDRSAEHMFDSQLLRLEARLLDATVGPGERIEARLLDALAVAERHDARLFALYAANDLLDLPQGARHAGSGRLDALSSWWRESGQGRDIDAVQRFLARS